ATAASASMLWNISGFPPTGRYCLGTASPMRVPWPAAGTMAETLGMKLRFWGLHYRSKLPRHEGASVVHAPHRPGAGGVRGGSPAHRGDRAVGRNGRVSQEMP